MDGPLFHELHMTLWYESDSKYVKYVVHWLESKIFQGLEGKNVKTFRELHFLFPIFFAANTKVKVQFVSKMNEQGKVKLLSVILSIYSYTIKVGLGCI